jgi:putative acetyltransferase
MSTPPGSLIIKRTNSEDPDFVFLVSLLDAHLRERDGADHGFYSQFNTIDRIRHAIVAYADKEAVGCGAIKDYHGAAEIKRMYTKPEWRMKSVAKKILGALEEWAVELGYDKCILETGKRQPEAISLYTRCGYLQIPNYGQYEGVDNSVCFEKRLSNISS